MCKKNATLFTDKITNYIKISVFTNNQCLKPKKKKSLLNKCRPVTNDKSSLQVLGFGDDAVWVTLLKSGHDFWVQKMDAIQLVPKSHPAGERTNPER